MNGQTYFQIREFWKSLDWSKGNKRLSEETGYYYSHVVLMRKKYASPLRDYVRKYWESIDWSKENKVLIRETGKLGTTISQWRKKLGKPSVTKYSDQIKKGISRAEALLMAQEDRASDSSLAKAVGISRQRFHQLLNPEQRRTAYLTNKIFKDIPKPDCCLICGTSSDSLSRHHPDYSKPFLVIWACASCHKIADAQRRLREIQSKAA